MVYCILCEFDVDVVVELYLWNDVEVFLFVYFILKSREFFFATARWDVFFFVLLFVVGEYDFFIEFVCVNFVLNFFIFFFMNFVWLGLVFVFFGTFIGTIYGKLNRIIVVVVTELMCEYGVLFWFNFFLCIRMVLIVFMLLLFFIVGKWCVYIMLCFLMFVSE